MASEVTIRIGASEICPGDHVLVSDGAWVRVVDSVMTMHRGLGPFDDFHIFLGAHVEFPEQEGAHIHTWELHDRVTIRRSFAHDKAA